MTTKVIDRQHPFVGLTPLLGIANLGAGNGIEFKVRPGTLVLRVFLQTITAFDTASTGTATATVTDGTTVFVNAADIKTEGAETVANAPKYYPTGGTISVNLSETIVTTGATVGAALAGIEYVIVGNGNAGIEE